MKFQLAKEFNNTNPSSNGGTLALDDKVYLVAGPRGMPSLYAYELFENYTDPFNSSKAVQLWNVSTSDTIVASVKTGFDDKLAYYIEGGHVVCVETLTGSEQWRHQTGNETVSDFAIVDNRFLVFGTANGYTSLLRIGDGPTASPSLIPSMIPTKDPSSMPSVEPTSKPSMAPSKDPSLMPSTEPTSEPSMAPTEDPSSMPSAEPTSEPSNNPSSVNPSHFPTYTETDSPFPTPSGTDPPTKVDAYDSSNISGRQEPSFVGSSSYHLNVNWYGAIICVTIAFISV